MLLHLLLILQSLICGHLIRIWILSCHLVITSLHHDLLWHLLLLNGMGIHLLLTDDDPFVIIDAWHVYHLCLELV